MRFGPLAASLLGSLGGSSLGGRLLGRNGALIGSLVGSLVGGSMGSSAGQGGGLGGLLGGLLSSHQSQGNTNLTASNFTASNLPASAAVSDLDDAHAEILLRAMCAAAKSDGTVDDQERHAIIARMGAVTADEAAWLDRELAGPSDVNAIVSAVPAGFGAHVYGASLLAVGAASGPEATYLQQLAAGLGLTDQQVAEIHSMVGAA